MLTLSNKISISRILFIPPLVFSIIQVHRYAQYRYVCLILIFIICLSDILDGYIARKRDEVTRLGVYLDPIADKLVLMVSCIMLSSDRLWPAPRLPNWIPTIIVCRDLTLILGTLALLLITGRVNCKPTILGKASTCLQIAAIVAVIVGNHVPVSILTTIWWMVAVLTFASGIFYVYRNILLQSNNRR
ncbi:MAG: CDP-alcohol phosphatidyltransferase family protein [Planctomycetota bacterium]